MRFSESSQNSISVKSIFGHSEVFFSTYELFPGRECNFPVSALEEKYFNEKMSPLASLKKKSFNLAQKYRVWPFLTTWVHLQRFSQRTVKISKNPQSVSCERLLRTLCQILSFLSLLACGGVYVLQVDIFQNP